MHFNNWSKTVVSPLVLVYPFFLLESYLSFTCSVLVNIRQNAALVKYYLRLLKTRKESFIASYRRSSWELLSPEEQNRIALLHIKQNKNFDLERKIRFNQLLRSHRLLKQQRRLEKSTSSLLPFLLISIN